MRSVIPRSRPLFKGVEHARSHRPVAMALQPDKGDRDWNEDRYGGEDLGIAIDRYRTRYTKSHHRDTAAQSERRQDAWDEPPQPVSGSQSQGHCRRLGGDVAIEI